jgi:DNA-binding response OmpR family regulator
MSQGIFVMHLLYPFDMISSNWNMEAQERSTVEKRVLVLSDSDLLFEVIEANLKQICLQVDGNQRPGKSDLQHQDSKQIRDDDCDLIIVALSSPYGEQVVTLFDAALTGQIGRVPLLIISERSFDASNKGKIFHLEFPFDARELRHKVQGLLD